MYKMRHRVVFLAFATVCCTITSQASREDALMETMPVYTMALRADILNSTTCRRELEEFRDGVDRRFIWAVNVLDSSGRPKPGFMDGNNYWLGSRGQCDDLSNRVTIPVSKRARENNTRYRNPNEEFPPFPVHYVVAYIQHGSTFQYNCLGPFLDEDKITLGICVPVSCTTEELGAILKRIFRDRTLLFGDLYATDLKLVEVKNLNDDYRWLIEPRFLIFGSVLTVAVLLATAGTVFDVKVHQKRLKSKQRSLANKNNAAEQTLETEEPEIVAPKPETTFQQVLLSFSVYTNTKQIFETKLKKGNISAFNGLKFFSMALLLVGHASFYDADFTENKMWPFRATRTLSFHTLEVTMYGIENFFFISGFLLSYLFLKSELKKEKCKSATVKTKVYWFFLIVFKRYVRITPAYIMAIGLAQFSWTWFDKASIFRMARDKPQVTCAKYWWRNILYINNFYKREEMCLSWSWYLSNDMQFFIIGTSLLLLSTTHFYLACFILCGLLVGSTFTAGYISHSLHYDPTLDEKYRLLSTFYDPPWMRIGPYIVGMITGYLILRSNNKLNLNKKALALLWCLALSCYLVIFFSTWDKDISPFRATLLTALGGTVWSLGTALIVTACCVNNDGIANSILSFKWWAPFSKLTYCVYLLNPIIISSTYLYSEDSMYFSAPLAVIIALGMITSCYLGAYVWSLLVEMPCSLVLNRFLNNRMKAT